MVEVFKTDITTSKEVESVETMLSYHLGYTRVTCDTKNRHRMLRVESTDINPPAIINLLSRMGYYCQVIR